MHRAMKVGNRICYERDTTRGMKEHRSRLKAIKTTSRVSATTGLPPSSPDKQAFGHLRVNRKRRQMREEEAARIENDNRMLMQRMHSLVHAPQTREGGATPVTIVPGIVLGPSQNPVIDCHLPASSPSLRGVSLNDRARRAEQRRVQRENVQILRRLESRSATHTAKEWKEHQQRVERFLKHMTSVTTAGHLPRKKKTPSKATSKRAQTASLDSSIGSGGPGSSFTYDDFNQPPPTAPQMTMMTNSPSMSSSFGSLPPPSAGGSRGRAAPLPLRPVVEEGALSLMDAEVQDESSVLRINVVLVLTRGGPSGAQPATTGVRVTVSDEQRNGSLFLSVPNLKELLRELDAEELDAVRERLDTLKWLDCHGNYERPTESWTPDEVEALSALLVRQLDVQLHREEVRVGMDLVLRAEDPVERSGDGGASTGPNSAVSSPVPSIRRSMVSDYLDFGDQSDSAQNSARTPMYSPPPEVDELAAFRDQQAQQRAQAEKELREAQRAMMADAQEDFFPPCTVISLDEAKRQGRIDGFVPEAERRGYYSGSEPNSPALASPQSRRSSPKKGAPPGIVRTGLSQVSVPILTPAPTSRGLKSPSAPAPASAAPPAQEDRLAVFRAGRKYDSTYYTIRLQCTKEGNVMASACASKAATARELQAADLPPRGDDDVAAWLRSVSELLHVKTWGDGRPEFLFGPAERAAALQHKFATVVQGQHAFVTLALGANGQLQVQVSAFETGVAQPVVRDSFPLPASMSGHEVDAKWLATVARQVQLRKSEETGQVEISLRSS